ncbi:hypothetical protein JIG36_33790 [Actinoplanes sp. LDG1-06]|uniref:Restriction endonuclease n=1 Tax=Paractinoplanes ovalisporus TaxID=2810368 RepID=A0ABS2AL46_9ACTN|nr:hypothetical protein [Actinoplanes ovalisporus]MBM2620493.1 hypothetical protein [Actinoplanes ovalisporus]
MSDNPLQDQAAPSEADHQQVDDQFEPTPLTAWERVGALLFGTLAGGGGAWSVFATDNQAGSAVLVLSGAAFALMGLQGTPLIRLGTGEHGVELERRRRRVERAIEQARTEDSVEVAAGIVEAASIIEPSLMQLPRYRADLYLTRLTLALQAAGATVVRNDHDRGPDLTLIVDRKMVDVEVKYGERGSLGMNAIYQAQSFARGSVVPILVITNLPLSSSVMSNNQSVVPVIPNDSERPTVEAVTWTGEADNPVLSRALLRALARIAPSDE